MRVPTWKSFIIIQRLLLYHLYIALCIILDGIAGCGWSCNHLNNTEEEGLGPLRCWTLLLLSWARDWPFFFCSFYFLSLCGHVTQQQQLVVCQQESRPRKQSRHEFFLSVYTRLSSRNSSLFGQKENKVDGGSSKHSKKELLTRRDDTKRKEKGIQPAVNVCVVSSSFWLSCFIGRVESTLFFFSSTIRDID